MTLEITRLLEISPDSSLPEIRKAYHKRRREIDPDMTWQLEKLDTAYEQALIWFRQHPHDDPTSARSPHSEHLNPERPAQQRMPVNATCSELQRQAMELLGMPDAKIGVAGFNAHCSENGLFGDEEARAIIPAIEQAQAEGINVDGPVPPDTVFVKAQAGQYGIVVAMYHDQGHIPLKLAGFKLDLKTNKYTAMSGVNSTIGLPIIRTSVDHGTAFGKAGEGRANKESLVDAMDMAILMAKNRKNVTK